MSNAIALNQNQGHSLFPSESEWRMLKEQAEMVVKTGFLPQAVNTPEKAITIALKGRELGIPPMQAYAHIHIIQGKPTISAELMLSLIFKNCPGAVVNYVQTSNDSCVIEAKRPNGSAARFSFTMDDAKRADLLGKGNWKNYPGAMLRARAIAIMARALFPDAIMGCSYTPEELGAEIDEEGSVIDVQSSTPPQEHKEPAPIEPIAEKPQAKPVIIIKPGQSSENAQKRELSIQIFTAGNKLGMTVPKVNEWIEDNAGVALKDATPEEMKHILEELNRQYEEK